MAFLKFLIIGFGIFYFLKLIVKALFPFLVKKTFDKMQNEAQKQQQAPPQEKGKVTIKPDSNSKANRNKKDNVEDVDFEEID